MFDLAAYDHPSFRTAAGTAVGYLLVLAVMTLLLFGIPYALFVLV
ncbi:hypothetical protein [Halomarina ordinaria]|uniref:ABC transporter permease n=1 Tax=Halomarina ordinaria TaxID=3033939 RepID=A0ABD5UBX2_9EURY|nr:hypothetical protein [Halomarina sp. PSRA2]